MKTLGTFLSELTDALELEFEAQGGDEFRDYDDWDSLMFLSLVTYLRESCGFEMTREVFESVDTWEDIYQKLPQ